MRIFRGSLIASRRSLFGQDKADFRVVAASISYFLSTLS